MEKLTASEKEWRITKRELEQEVDGLQRKERQGTATVTSLQQRLDKEREDALYLLYELEDSKQQVHGEGLDLFAFGTNPPPPSPRKALSLACPILGWCTSRHEHSVVGPSSRALEHEHMVCCTC